jgi:ribosomal protein L7/L12
MTGIKLALDVTDLRDRQNGSFYDPQVSITVAGQSIVVELCRIPVDQSNTVRELSDEVCKLNRTLAMSEQDCTYWRVRHDAAARELSAMRLKHLPTDLIDAVRSFYPVNKIEAIKAVREKTSLDLREAKELMDGFWLQLAAEQAQIEAPATA